MQEVNDTYTTLSVDTQGTTAVLFEDTYEISGQNLPVHEEMNPNYRDSENPSRASQHIYYNPNLAVTTKSKVV